MPGTAAAGRHGIAKHCSATHRQECEKPGGTRIPPGRNHNQRRLGRALVGHIQYSVKHVALANLLVPQRHSAKYQAEAAKDRQVDR
jgi:hypothetical protein